MHDAELEFVFPKLCVAAPGCLSSRNLSAACRKMRWGWIPALLHKQETICQFLVSGKRTQRIVNKKQRALYVFN